MLFVVWLEAVSVLWDGFARIIRYKLYNSFFLLQNAIPHTDYAVPPFQSILNVVRRLILDQHSYCNLQLAEFKQQENKLTE